MDSEERRQEIGRRLKQVRLSKKLSQRQIADYFGLVKSAWSQYESGKRIPRDKTKERIARYAGVSVQELFYD